MALPDGGSGHPIRVFGSTNPKVWFAPGPDLGVYELVSFDRGKGKTGYFTYDLEGHILSRSDRPTRNTDGAYIEGFTNDPDAWWATDDYGGFNFLSYLRRRWQFGAATQGVTQLKSFVYANGKPVAEASTDHTLTQKKLTLISRL